MTAKVAKEEKVKEAKVSSRHGKRSLFGGFHCQHVATWLTQLDLSTLKVDAAAQKAAEKEAAAAEKAEAAAKERADKEKASLEKKLKAEEEEKVGCDRSTY